MNAAAETFQKFVEALQDPKLASFSGTLNGYADRLDRMARQWGDDGTITPDVKRQISRLASDLRDITTLRDAAERKADYVQWVAKLNAISLPV